jgi:hypothetical protein
MCHEYGHFARNCPKRKQAEVETGEAQEEGWKQVKKKENIGRNGGSKSGEAIPSQNTNSGIVEHIKQTLRSKSRSLDRLHPKGKSRSQLIHLRYW